MSRLNFMYSMKIDYSVPVDTCFFTIKCIPRDSDRQKLLGVEIDIEPEAEYTINKDSLGNKKIIGKEKLLHNYFYLNVKGEIEIEQMLYEEYTDANLDAMYKYMYGKVCIGPELSEYFEKLSADGIFGKEKSSYNKAVDLMRRFHSDYEYKQLITDTETDSEQAFKLGGGVCQDYAHIYIALCRKAGLAARYVTGLFVGEGASHAWVEVLCKNKWIGFDPTNNLLVDDNYIKISHGRDANDCIINLGIMRRKTGETKSVLPENDDQRMVIEAIVTKKDK